MCFVKIRLLSAMHLVMWIWNAPPLWSSVWSITFWSRLAMFVSVSSKSNTITITVLPFHLKWSRMNAFVHLPWNSLLLVNLSSPKFLSVVKTLHCTLLNDFWITTNAVWTRPIPSLPEMPDRHIARWLLLRTFSTDSHIGSQLQKTRGIVWCTDSSSATTDLRTVSHDASLLWPKILATLLNQLSCFWAAKESIWSTRSISSWTVTMSVDCVNFICYICCVIYWNNQSWWFSFWFWRENIQISCEYD